MVTWTHKTGDKYLLVGTDARGKRFRKVPDNYHYMAAHNCYNARLYHVPADGGKRLLVKRWSN